MKLRLLAVPAIAALALTLSPALAATSTVYLSFSGVVGAVSTTTIDVTDATTKRTETFAIVPTDGYGVVSADGKTTYQMSAIKVGWPVRVEYDEIASGQKHADHVFVTR
jgi:uncharacterized OB-fold protein